MKKTILILLSGFLGSGKTTLMLAAADHLRSREYSVACVTNDQGAQLVDSKMVFKKELPLAQIQGGCFCCRFDELVESINRIMEDHGPDVIVAEAVGSCTDLVATVIKPLQQFHGERLDIRPLTVVVDPMRLSESLRASTRLTAEIDYLFGKQLEEAQCILLNKTDLLHDKQTGRLVEVLEGAYPAKILTASTLQNEGVAKWLDVILNAEQLPLPVLDIDYDIYADGEAQLGWFNGSFQIVGQLEDTAFFCRALFDTLTERFILEEAEIAHLKLWAEDGKAAVKMSAVGSSHVSRTDLSPSTRWITDKLTLWLNARVNIFHGDLRKIVIETLDIIEKEHSVKTLVERMDCFSPSRPQPTYRMA